MLGAMTACFMLAVLANGLLFLKYSKAYVLYFSGPLSRRGSCRWWPSSKMAKYWPSAARLSERPLPPRVSMMGYVANEDAWWCRRQPSPVLLLARRTLAHPLFAVGHELGARLLEALHSLGSSLFLRGQQLVTRRRPRVVGGNDVLQVLGPGQGSNGLGRDGHYCFRSVVFGTVVLGA